MKFYGLLTTLTAFACRRGLDREVVPGLATVAVAVVSRGLDRLPTLCTWCCGDGLSDGLPEGCGEREVSGVCPAPAGEFPSRFCSAEKCRARRSTEAGESVCFGEGMAAGTTSVTSGSGTGSPLHPELLWLRGLRRGV